MQLFQVIRIFRLNGIPTNDWLFFTKVKKKVKRLYYIRVGLNPTNGKFFVEDVERHRRHKEAYTMWKKKKNTGRN